jgi:hypothetical protein
MVTIPEGLETKRDFCRTAKLASTVPGSQPTAPGADRQAPAESGTIGLWFLDIPNVFND